MIQTSYQSLLEHLIGLHQITQSVRKHCGLSFTRNKISLIT